MGQVETEIRRLVADAVRHQSDTAQFVMLHAEDASVINIAGRLITSRTALETAMSAALASPLADVHTTAEVEDIRMLTEDVAIVRCLKRVIDRRTDVDAAKKDLPTEARLTYVVVKRAGGWLIASAQTTPILS